VCILKANFIDVKISAWLPVFLTTLNLVSFSRKIFTVIFVCIYLRAFKKKKEEKKERKRKI
jgi:predicted membrane protein